MTECADSIFEASPRLADLKRAPWDVLSSRELAGLLGVSIQVLANWRIRGHGPAPAPAECYRGNRTYYPVYEIEAWLEEIEPWRAVQKWLQGRFHFPTPIETEERTWRMATKIRGDRIHRLQHRPRRPLPLPPVK